MKELKFGEVVTPEMAEQLREGDFSGLNTTVTNAMQNSVQQTLIMAAKMLNSFEEKMNERMKEVTHQSQSVHEAKRELSKAIPSASNPKFKPIIEGVFAQAMKHNKGDVSKSIEMTREFLSGMTSTTGADLGLRVTPPGSPGYNAPGANAGEDGQPNDWAAEIFGVIADK